MLKLTHSFVELSRIFCLALLQKGGLSHDPTVKKKEKLDVKSSTLYKVLLLGENGCV